MNLSEASSRLVEAMIRDADYCGRISSFTLPGCILLIDPFRLEQVIGNILNNAYKYAGSDINVVSDLTEDGLRIEFMDYGRESPMRNSPASLPNSSAAPTRTKKPMAPDSDSISPKI